MSIKIFFAKILARKAYKKVQKWAHQPIKTQHDVFCNLIDSAKHTQFGQDHGFDQIKTHADYKARVPIRDYEALRPYVEKAVAGNQDILWTGKPLYFAKTSGTTSGTKYIPITKASMPHHIEAAKNALFFQ